MRGCGVWFQEQRPRRRSNHRQLVLKKMERRHLDDALLKGFQAPPFGSNSDCWDYHRRSCSRQQVGYSKVSTTEWFQAPARETGTPGFSKKAAFFLVIVVV